MNLSIKNVLAYIPENVYVLLAYPENV